jgi:C-terminal processing protease CtpA/Prc
LLAPYTSCNQFLPNAERVPTPDGDFGYVRIFTFQRLEGTKEQLTDDQMVAKFQEQVASLVNNTKGLIIDVRDNGGGASRASERCVQIVKQTANQIEPCKFYFRVTNEALRLCQLGATVPAVQSLGCGGMDQWVKSIAQATDKETFSEAFRYTCPDAANKIGRIYPGPVIVVTSALSYSAAELFAAAFQDHGGLILGVDETTGGGGAGVREHKELHKYFIDGKQQSPLQDLQSDRGKGGFSVAFRRSVRVGLGAGKEIEDVGIACNHKHEMTRNDLLNHNADLKMHAAGLLAKMK